VAVVALLGYVPTAFATTLAANTGATAATNYSISGTVLDELTGSWSQGSQAGNFVVDVVLDSGTGKLDFLYQVEETGNQDIARVTVSDFVIAGATVEAGNATSLSLIGATSLTTSGSLTSASTVDRSFFGDSVGFQLNPVIFPASVVGSHMSTVLVVKTQSTAFTSGTIGVIDGTTVNLQGLGPVAPLPATANAGLLLLGGLGGLGGVRRLSSRRTVQA